MNNKQAYHPASRLWLSALVLLLLVALPPRPACALEVTSNWHQLNAEFDYLEDPNGSIEIDDLLMQPDRYRFTSSAESKPGTTFAPVWLRLRLAYTPETRARQYMVIARMENLLDLRIYREQEDGSFREFITGNNYPANSRELEMPRYAFTIPSDVDDTVVYIRMVGGAGSNNLAWDLIELGLHEAQTRAYYLITASCLAAIGALLMFNFLLALSLRRKDYLYYSGYILFTLLALVTLEGYGFWFLWPELPWLNERALSTFALTSAMLRLMAVNAFLKVSSRMPILHRASQLILAFMLFTIVITNITGASGLPPLAPFLPWLIGSAMVYAVCIGGIRRRIALAWPLLLCMLVPNFAALAQTTLTIQSPMMGMAVMQFSKVGFTLHVLMFSICLAAHIRYEMQSREKALHDELTGLPGQRLLRERFKWMSDIAKRDVQELTVLFIDLDGFKVINDSLGHAAGDELLCEAARRMSGQLRDTDVLARLGGDEFVVILSSAPSVNPAYGVSRKLIKALSAPFSINGRYVSVSASIGVARSPADGNDLDSLLQAADAAMYRAKKNGKNSYALSRMPPAA